MYPILSRMTCVLEDAVRKKMLATDEELGGYEFILANTVAFNLDRSAWTEEAIRAQVANVQVRDALCRLFRQRQALRKELDAAYQELRLLRESANESEA